MELPSGLEGSDVAEYVKPGDVISPKAIWSLFDVILDRGEGNCAYALGTWNGERRVGFRWNGDDAVGPLGNPQSRGLPTWTMLDPALHKAILDLLPVEKRALAKGFLAVREGEELREIVDAAGDLHAATIKMISGDKWPCKLQNGARLLLHIIPFSAVNGTLSRGSTELFRSPNRFPPISGGSRPTPTADSRIGFDGLLCGSNSSGLSEPQRASVHVTLRGIVEAVASVGFGAEGQFIESPKVLQIIIRYARVYAKALNECGIEFPVVVFASLQGIKEGRLLQDLLDGAVPEDIPCGYLKEPSYTFLPTIFESVPSTESESASILRATLDHVSQTAGLPSASCFDAAGKYLLRDYAW